MRLPRGAGGARAERGTDRAMPPPGAGSEPPHPERVPRYASWATFARLPVEAASPAPGGGDTAIDVGVVGIPFDGGCTYRSGARFGPAAIRQASRLLRAYNAAQGVYAFRGRRVADMGDIVCTPFQNVSAVEQIRLGMRELLRTVRRPVVLGGDHTISYPVLRALHEHRGGGRGLALVHLDSHLDTWDSYFGEAFTHGTPFKRAFDEGVIDPSTSMHVGVRGSVNGPEDAEMDAEMGFRTIGCDEVHRGGAAAAAARVRRRVGGSPCYLSIDVDVADPSVAPGTGTPESGGLSAAQLLSLVRGLRGLDWVGFDVVEVAPPYDTSEITSTLAATLAYEMVCLTAAAPARL